jgi:hypothetical protein
MKIEKTKVFGSYKRLISFYPRSFNERFGESMEQTFNDICNERNGKISLWLMVSIFTDTTVGIIKENLHEFKSANQMNGWLKIISIAAFFSLLFSTAFFSVGSFFKDNPEVWAGNGSFPINDFIRKWLFLTLILTPIVSGLRSNESTAMKGLLMPLVGAALFSVTLIAPFAWMEWSNNPLIRAGESLFPYPLFLVLLLAPMLVFLGAVPIVRRLKACEFAFAHPILLLLRVGFLSLLAMGWVFLITKHMPFFLGSVPG